MRLSVVSLSSMVSVVGEAMRRSTVPMHAPDVCAAHVKPEAVPSTRELDASELSATLVRSEHVVEADVDRAS